MNNVRVSLLACLRAPQEQVLYLFRKKKVFSVKAISRILIGFHFLFNFRRQRGGHSFICINYKYPFIFSFIYPYIFIVFRIIHIGFNDFCPGCSRYLPGSVFRMRINYNYLIGELYSAKTLFYVFFFVLCSLFLNCLYLVLLFSFMFFSSL
jgi:hypothetical protein